MSQMKAGSFYDAISAILRTIQYFGLLPVQGLAKKDIFSLKFKWKSFLTFYSIIFIILGLIDTSALFYESFMDSFSLKNTSSLSFYFICLCNATNFFILAQKWPKLMVYWYEHEKVFLQHPYFIQGWSLKRKMRIVAFIFGFLAFGKYFIRHNLFGNNIYSIEIVEHFLYLSAVVYDNQKIIEWCNVNESEYFHSFAIKQHHHLLHFIPYHPVEIPIFEVIINSII